MFEIAHLSKTFHLHTQQQAEIPVVRDVGFAVCPGECVALTGESGSGKSTVLRLIYGNYLARTGSISVGGTEIVAADPRTILELRRTTLGYVTQFLRVLPRVPATRVVAEPMIEAGHDAAAADAHARDLLRRLRIPETLWDLSPLTFSGGEQQRVNIARGFAYEYPALLLDEPTASLDAANRQTVLEMIEAAKQRGCAIIGIFHDQAAREAVCDREIDVSQFAAA
ncbi:MAG: phosphonate C-P lyase system protein PhnL [Alphaproteobacteria bacterium]|jgi:alpha-D-ribose 1-methylphosphonate 5-triphosphate synthase subunit PhnL